MSLGLVRDRIAGRPARSPRVALAAVLDEGDRHQRLGAGHDDVDHPVDLGGGIGIPAEIRVEPDPGADEADVARAVGIDRRRADVRVPPVVRRKQRQRPGKHPAGLGRGDGGGEEGQGEEDSEAHGGAWPWGGESIVSAHS